MITKKRKESETYVIAYYQNISYLCNVNKKIDIVRKNID